MAMSKGEGWASSPKDPFKMKRPAEPGVAKSASPRVGANAPSKNVPQPGTPPIPSDVQPQRNNLAAWKGTP